MKKINVIDLDKTLLPYDSFRWLIKRELRRINLFIVFWVIIRKLKLVSGNIFKEKLTTYFGTKYSGFFFKSYAEKLYKDLDISILKLIDAKTCPETTNVLLSASPNLYVKELISILGWKGCGSYYNGDKYFNMYGENKLLWLEKNFYK